MSLPEDSAARRAAWSSYWATGGLHSCVGSFAGNYGGAIGEFWTDTFAALPAGPLRVLDLATGNGALPLMLWQQRGATPDLQVDAVDLAELAPAWHSPASHPGVRFHAGVSMEQLPFEDACFDLVTSQFGFEYARREPALHEALRVLKPGGRLALVMHHEGSVLVRVGRAELSHQQVLLAPDGLLAAAEAVIPWFARARQGADLANEPEALRCRSAYNTAIQAVARRIAEAPAPDLLVEARDLVHALLGATGPDPAPSLARLRAYREGLVAAGLRTAELVQCALTEGAAESLVRALSQARPACRIDCKPLAQAEGLLGWALRMSPADAAG